MSLYILTHRLLQPVFRDFLDLTEITALAKSPCTSVPGPAAHGGSCYRNKCTWHHQSSTHTVQEQRKTYIYPHTNQVAYISELHKIQDFFFLLFAHMVFLMHFKMPHQALLPNWDLKTNRWIHGTLPVIIIIVIADAQNTATKHICTKNCTIDRTPSAPEVHSANLQCSSSLYKCHNALWSDSNSMLTPWNETVTSHQRLNTHHICSTVLPSKRLQIDWYQCSPRW